MRKFVFVFALSAGLFPVLAHAQENPLLEAEFWQTATAEDVAKILAQGADIEATGADGGWTLLHSAAGFGKTQEVVGLLIDRGADIEARNVSGLTPLHAAVTWSKTPEVIAFLLDSGANMEARDILERTPLHLAAGFSSTLEIVELLLNRGANIKARAATGGTPLHFAAQYSKKPEVVAVLLERGADIEVRNKYGMTPLHSAVGFSETPEVVALLLDRGANHKAKNNEGQTPFDFIEKNKNLKGSDVYPLLNKAQENPLLDAEFLHYGGIVLIIIVLFVSFVIWNGSKTNISDKKDSQVAPYVKISKTSTHKNIKSAIKQDTHLGAYDKKESPVVPHEKFSKTSEDENTKNVIKRDTYLSDYDENKSAPINWNVTRRRKPLQQNNTSQYTQEFDSKLLEMLEEARSEGKTTCVVVSKKLHDRVAVESQTSRITAACYAMWKLWERQGSDMDNVICDIPSGQSNKITIRFKTFFNEEKNHQQEKFDSKLLQMLEEERNEGKTMCTIVSKQLYNRVLIKPKMDRMPMARNAMWKLWEKQGHHEERILKPRSKDEISFIKITFDTGLSEEDTIQTIQNKNLDVALKNRETHERIQLLLDAGADVNAWDWQGNMSLHQAVIASIPDDRYPDIDKVIEVLLKEGANANAQNNYGETPSDIAQRSKYLDVYWRLYKTLHPNSQKNIKGNLLNSRFWQEATVDDVVRYIYSLSDINAKIFNGKTLLHWAARYNKTREVIVALLIRGAHIEASDEDGRTALHHAVFNNSSAVVELLLNKGADAKKQDREGKTPFDIAKGNEHLQGTHVLKRLEDEQHQ